MSSILKWFCTINLRTPTTAARFRGNSGPAARAAAAAGAPRPAADEEALASFLIVSPSYFEYLLGVGFLIC